MTKDASKNQTDVRPQRMNHSGWIASRPLCVSAPHRKTLKGSACSAADPQGDIEKPADPTLLRVLMKQITHLADNHLAAVLARRTRCIRILNSPFGNPARLAGRIPRWAAFL
jgi:hypothetical protein